MSDAPIPTCPFVVGSKVTEQRAFIGRQDERAFIISHMDGDQPTSVCLYGPRRIGKSSLLYHIFQTYEERVNQPARIVVIYLSLQQANCRNQDDFYQAVADEFLKLPKVSSRDELANPLQQRPFNQVIFEQALKQWKQAGVLPVICLDDFEELLDRTDRFNDDFYDNLRSLIGDRALMMVIASRQRLIKYSRQKRLTSDFFNVFQAGRLKEFSDTEAQDLVRLPHPEQPALGEEKQTLALQWGGHHPCLLQIAGRCLWEARQRDRSNDWAKAQFHERSLGVPQPLHLIKHGVREVTRLGQLGQWIGDTQDSLGNFLKGAFIIVLIVLAITGVATWPQIQQWFKDTTTETLENFE